MVRFFVLDNMFRLLELLTSIMYFNKSFALHAGEGLFPSFDHAVGDPKEAEIHIEPHHRVVLIEGNYLLLGESILKTLQHSACLQTFRR